METNTKISHVSSLEQAGLALDQATIYELLIQNGAMPAGKISQKTPLKRGLVYKVLDELIGMGLVLKKEVPGKVALFEPAHPLKLKELAEKKEEQAKNAQVVLGGILGQLISNYNLNGGRPGVRFFEGVSGVEKIYEDILETGKDILLMRAIYEVTYAKQLNDVVNKFVNKRVKAGLHVTALTPQDEFITPDRIKLDEKNLLTRVIVKKELYNSPVEITIYGDRLAILSYGKELIGLIIESPQITIAFRQMFNLLRLGAEAARLINQ